MHDTLFNTVSSTDSRPVGWGGALGAFAPPFLVEKAT